LLAEHSAVVGGARHLMHLRVEGILIWIVARVLVGAVAPLLNLLQQIVLVLTHHDVSILLALFKLVF
jgi:uncharacterized protein YggT (Ycf19 family)